MSASTPLIQGQANDPRNTPNEMSRSVVRAPMAEVEEVDDERNGNVNTITDSNTRSRDIPHVVVSQPSDSHETIDIKSSHFGEDGVDGPLVEGQLYLSDLRPNTPHSTAGRVPHLNFEHELGSIAGDNIPDINVYQHKKTLAQGMMDLALFSANANQLRYVLDSFNRHPYYWPSVVCIVLSLGFQVAIGIGLIWNALYDVKDEKEICIANRINNWCVIGIFLVVVINVFISAFGVADPMPVSVAPPATTTS